MPVLFWVDIIGLCISILVAGSLTLLVVVVDPNNQKNRSFGMFTGTMVIWTGAAILLRLSLWLEPVFPTSLFLPNPYPWLVISTVSIPLMCILSLMFTATYLDRRTRWTDLSIGAGLLLVIFFLIRSMVTKGAVIPDVYIDANGLVVHEIRTSALVALGMFNLYILRSIVLFWRERHSTEANYLALGLLILLLGLIFRTFVYAPFPILSFSNALCAMMLAYGVISNQLFNPLRARTIELNKEMEERKEVERVLRESEEKYRLIADNTADLISVLDMNLHFTYVSPASMRIRGYTAEEAMEQTLEQILTPESTQLGLSIFEEEMQLEASGTADPDRTRILELEEYRKDGSTVWVEANLSLLRDKDRKPVGILIVTRDISERKQAEKKLRESEQSYRLLAIYHKRLNDISIAFTEVSGTEDLYNIISESLRFLTGAIATTFSVYNKGTRTLKVASLSTDPISSGKAGNIFGPELFEMLMPVGADEMELMLRQSIGRPKDLRELSFGIIPQEISDAVMDAVGCRQIVALAISHAGELLGTCVVYLREDQPVVMDDALKTFMNLSGLAITRKQADAEKAKLEEQYRQAQKMEAIGQLAGGVAHDFNNMLNIILGYSQLALMKIEPSNPLKADLQEIINATQRSTELVRQLLAFARKQTIAPKVLDLNDTVAGMLNMLQRLIGEDIDLIWMPAANLWPVRMDPTQIDQILANLAVNARDSISGVGKITIETGKAEFDAVYCAQNAGFVPGHYVMLAVSDNGCGMDQETCEKIFEPFFTTKEVGKGTGMGLATVYGIVKQNNWFINVYSEPGKGTTFKIYIPMQGKGEMEIDEPSLHSGPLTGTETLLLVEDDAALLKMAETMLKGLGYTVLTAGTPGEAIRLAGEHAGGIHLMLTDVIMPEMSGRDLQKHIITVRPGIKCLFMSGYTANVIAHHGVLDEGVNFLQKPFNMEGLSLKVREALDRE